MLPSIVAKKELCLNNLSSLLYVNSFPEFIPNARVDFMANVPIGVYAPNHIKSSPSSSPWTEFSLPSKCMVESPAAK